MTAPVALVVDDDAVTLILLRHMLEGQGFTVVTASSIADARDRLVEGCSLVVLDYLLDGETGLELMPWIDGVPVILLTGVAERGEIPDARVDEVDAHLTKPVSTDELRTVVERLVTARA